MVTVRAPRPGTRWGHDFALASRATASTAGRVPVLTRVHTYHITSQLITKITASLWLNHDVGNTVSWDAGRVFGIFFKFYIPRDVRDQEPPREDEQYTGREATVQHRYTTRGRGDSAVTAANRVTRIDNKHQSARHSTTTKWQHLPIYQYTKQHT